jgi:hypothetical protein
VEVYAEGRHPKGGWERVSISTASNYNADSQTDTSFTRVRESSNGEVVTQYCISGNETRRRLYTAHAGERGNVELRDRIHACGLMRRVHLAIHASMTLSWVELISKHRAFKPEILRARTHPACSSSACTLLPDRMYLETLRANTPGL